MKLQDLDVSKEREALRARIQEDYIPHSGFLMRLSEASGIPHVTVYKFMIGAANIKFEKVMALNRAYSLAVSKHSSLSNSKKPSRVTAKKKVFN